MLNEAPTYEIDMAIPGDPDWVRDAIQRIDDVYEGMAASPQAEGLGVMPAINRLVGQGPMPDELSLTFVAVPGDSAIQAHRRACEVLELLLRLAGLADVPAARSLVCSEQVLAESEADGE